MKWTSLDTIVKGVLISKQYPIHFYMQLLYLGSRAYEELHFDSLSNIKTVKLAINEYKAISLPCDFMDWVKIGIPVGQFVQPLSQRQGITRLNNFNSEGEKVLHGSGILNSEGSYDALFFSGSQQFYNSNGDFTGRMFGMGSGDDTMTFRYLPERGEVQLHEGLAAEEIILQYISDGSEIDNATMITPYAKSAIENYIIWKMKEGSRAYGMGERQEARLQWEHQHRLFRARKFGLTGEKIKAIVRKNTHGSIKG